MSFININDTNIKLSNIKQYGVSSEYRFIDVPVYEKVYKDSKPYKPSKLNFIKRLFDSYHEYDFTGEYKRLDIITGNYIPSLVNGEVFYCVNKSNESGLDIISFKDITAKFNPELKPNKIIYKYLYITTFQNDNFRFYDYQIKVNEKHRELIEKSSK